MRKKDKRSGGDTATNRRRREFVTMLQTLGLEDDFKALPLHNVNAMFFTTMPLPKVELAPSPHGRPEDLVIVSEIEAALRNGKFKLPRHGTPISLRQFFGSYLRLSGIVRDLVRKKATHRAVERLAGYVGENDNDLTAAAASRMWWLAVDVLIRHTRFDQSMPTFEIAMRRTDNGRPCFVIRVSRCDPVAAQIEVDGKRRPAWQCTGQPFKIAGLGPQALDRIAWKPAELGIDSPLETAPVMVQSHAIDDFRKRVGFEDESQLLFDWFVHALRTRDVRKRDGDTFFIAFQFLGYRVGYFVVKWVESVFLVRSFLFLTMEGTPEADALYRRFRTQRTGVEIMNLDCLSSFVHTDLRADAELSGLLREAGCGHLLDLATKIRNEDPGIPLAARIRLYLGRPLRSPVETGSPTEANVRLVD